MISMICASTADAFPSQGRRGRQLPQGPHGAKSEEELRREGTKSTRRSDRPSYCVKRDLPPSFFVEKPREPCRTLPLLFQVFDIKWTVRCFAASCRTRSRELSSAASHHRFVHVPSHHPALPSDFRRAPSDQRAVCVAGSFRVTCASWKL